MLANIEDKIKMWLLWVKSLLMPDINRVPKDLGVNRVMITNNTIATSAGLKTIIEVKNLGSKVPENIISIIRRELSTRRLKVTADYVFRLQNCHPLTENKYTLKSKIDLWEKYVVSKDPAITDFDKINAKRSLDTINDMRTQNIIFRTRMFIILTGSSYDIYEATQVCKAILLDAECSYGVIQTDLKDVVKKTYITLLNQFKKTDPYFYASPKIISEIMPTPLRIVEKDGVTLGMDYYKNVPYKIDFSNKDKARNMMILALSGSGKTYMTYNIAQSAFENGERISIMDIKGTEFNKFIKSIGGEIINLSKTDNHYVNPFKMDVNAINKEKEWTTNRELAIDTFLLLSECKENEDEYKVLRTLFTSFIDTYYQNKSVIKENEKTWINTMDMTIRKVYEDLIMYINNSVDNKLFSEINPYIQNMRKYILGEYAYLFQEELFVNDFLKAPGISFAFHMIDEERSTTLETIYKLKFKYMNIISMRYAMNNYSQNIRTLKIMEEGQIAGDEVIDMYIRDFTIGRSIKQDNMFLANSLKAITERGRAICDNVTVLITAGLTDTEIATVVKEFGISQFRVMMEQTEKIGDHIMFIYDRLNDGVTSYIKTFSNFSKADPMYISVPDKD